MRVRPVPRRFSLDTNILVYAVDRDSGIRHDEAVELVGQAAKSDCVLTIQSLEEFFRATTRNGLLGPAHASAFVRDWLGLFDIASADDVTLVDAMDAVEEHRLSFWDAMLWAAARRARCSAILTEDLQDGRRLGGVEFLNPFRTENRDRLSLLLGN